MQRDIRLALSAVRRSRNAPSRVAHRLRDHDERVSLALRMPHLAEKFIDRAILLEHS
jgi:hypothetical protein